MTIIKPPRLRTGDRVALVSVSSPVPSAKDIDNMVKCLEGFGLDVDADENVLDRHGYLAGTDEFRSRALTRALRSPNIRAVFFAWGGKGANHLLSHIDYDAFRNDPKIVVGLSDPSCIINALTRVSGVVTFHGPTGVNFANRDGLDEFTRISFRNALFGATYPAPVPCFSSWQVLRTGQATGPLVGGHLSTVQTLLGSRYEPNWDGAIFFWEEVGRTPRAIDLSLWHFRLNGVFDRIAGMVVGRPLDCTDPDYDDQLDLIETIKNATRGFSFPILFNVDLGHADPKVTLPVGALAELVLLEEAEPQFTLLESGVS